MFPLNHGDNVRAASPARAGRKKRGFTFVETLAAMLFVAIVVPAAVQCLSVANRMAAMAERRGVAAQLANSLLTEITLTDEWRTTETEGDFGETYPGYRWRMEDDAWELDTMRVVSVGVFFVVQEREYNVWLSTLVDESDEAVL